MMACVSLVAESALPFKVVADAPIENAMEKAKRQIAPRSDNLKAVVFPGIPIIRNTFLLFS
jgi:hypothetical protein